MAGIGWNRLKMTDWMAMAGAGSALVLVGVLVLVGFEAVTRGENKLPHAQYTSEPPTFLQILDPL